MINHHTHNYLKSHPPRLKPHHINDTKSESFGHNLLHWRHLLCNPHWVNIIFTDKSSSFTWADLNLALTFVSVVSCLSRFCPCPQNWYFCSILASVVTFLPLPPFPPWFVINFGPCSCPCSRDWYFCPIFSGVVFALAPISSMFCHQFLPLPLPSQLSWQYRGQGQGQTLVAKHGGNGGKGKNEGKTINY